jgi:hypothetical protein
MKWNRYTTFGVLCGVLLLFVAAEGCSQLGLVNPQNVPDRLAYGYVTVTQVAQATESLLRQKKVSVKTAERVRDGLNLTLSALNESRDLYYSGNQKDATSRLNAALKVLEGAQLDLKGGKP